MARHYTTVEEVIQFYDEVWKTKVGKDLTVEKAQIFLDNQEKYLSSYILQAQLFA